MKRFPSDELARRSSLVALLFRLEQQRSPKGFNVLLNEVNDWFRRHTDCQPLEELFIDLIRQALLRCGKGPLVAGKMSEIEKMKTMLFSGIKQWEKEKRAEGKAEGKAEALISLLAGRFGPVAPSWRKRIEGARLGTLERWFKRAIVAPDVRSVFNPPR